MPVAARKPRQSQQERSAATTENIMEAAIKLLFNKGFTGLTIAQVASDSGVSQGAITHHYGNKVNLVLAAAEYTVDKECARIVTDIPVDFSRSEALEAYFDASESFFLNKQFIALIELFLAARRDPQISSAFNPLIAEHRRLFDETWQQVLTESGFEEREAKELIAMTNSILRSCSLLLVRQDEKAAWREIRDHCGIYRENFRRLFAPQS